MPTYDAECRQIQYQNLTEVKYLLKGMGHVTVSSFGIATIRMPIGDHYVVEIEVDIIDHENS